MTLPPGYHYANDTKFADLSGKSCEGKDFECVPFEDGSADLIIILHVLEHILPLDVPLRHLARIAKPGVGMMQIEVPCSPDAPTRLCRNESGGEQLVQSITCNQPDHLVDYNCDEFRKLVEESGWRCTVAGDSLIEAGETEETLQKVYGLLLPKERPQFLCRRTSRGGHPGGYRSGWRGSWT